jgi:hypothetical protein
MITGDIIYAIMQELKYLFLDKEGTVILDTQLKEDMSYNFPLCICEMDSAPESARLPGNGTTRLGYYFALRVYNFETNAYNEDDKGYATTLLDITDEVRQHFENEIWETQKMVDLTTNYGFRLTFGGINRAETLQIEDKMVMGYRLEFNTIAIDNKTNTYTDMTIENQTLTGEIVFLPLPEENLGFPYKLPFKIA